MSDLFQCGDNRGLVSYLYNECEPAEHAAIKAHVELCAACAAEIAALESARFQLSSWTPPDANLGFAIVRPQVSAPKPLKTPVAVPGLWSGAWLRQPLPAWAQAMAACLIFGIGLTLGVLRGTVPTAFSGTQATAATSTEAPAATASDLAALERRLRSEMASLRTVPVSTTSASPQSAGNAQLLSQVRALIDESEQRQQRELALRTAQVLRDFDSQRQVDLAQIQRNFGQIEGLTGAEVREQRQMLNYLLRVSEQPGR